MLAGPTTFVATHLSGANEVPANDSGGTGNAVFRLNKDGTELEYRLIVANIDNVVAAHIHLAPAGQNGPVVAFLYNFGAPGSGVVNGVLATGTITDADLIGPLAGRTIADLVTEIAAGNAYVNVHTNDGVPPTNTGPGDIASGEIRAQLR